MPSDADQLCFDLVTGKSDITSRESLQRIVAHPDGVVLAYKGAEIQVREIRIERHDLLVGQVAGFANICSTQYEGLRLGQVFSFRYAHIQHLA